MSDQSPSEPRLDAAAAKVLAHPLRSRLLSALRQDGPATATILAARLRSNTGATSYHLRKLAAVGLVVDTGEGTGRQRLWRAATQRHHWDAADFADDEDARAALSWLVRDYQRVFNSQYAAWLDSENEWPQRWRDAAAMSNAWIEVTADQLAQLREELGALVERYQQVGAGDPEARRVAVWRFAFPLEPDRIPGREGAVERGSPPDG